MEAPPPVWILIAAYTLVGVQIAFGATDPRDVGALRSLMSRWQNTPPSWGQSDDPCGANTWGGVTCSDSRVITLQLSSMGLEGTLHPDIGMLTGLQTLDLSFNNDLGGELPPNIGNLRGLQTLILAGCSFSGSIPEEIGSITPLRYLALNTNNFSGEIPASLGSLSDLYWFDISENQLTGRLPASTDTTPGLDNLLRAQHFHFNKNKLSGSIPPKIFHSEMRLIHVLFDGNQLVGTIPDTIGLVKTLEVVRLDRNQLEGPVPSSIQNLTAVAEMHLSNNQLTGMIPDLSGIRNLNFLGLSNNSFDRSLIPEWLTTLEAVTTLKLDSCGLHGEISDRLFALPRLQKIFMRNNDLNGTLDLTGDVSQQLELVDLRNNDINFLPPGYPDTVTLILQGNVVCENAAPNRAECQLEQDQTEAYSTSMGNCGSGNCPSGEIARPISCACVHPYQGELVFRAPSFSDTTNASRFNELERTMWRQLGLQSGSCALKDIRFTGDGYLRMTVSLFPSTSAYFNRTEIQLLGFSLANQTFKLPEEFGTYLFTAFPYIFAGESGDRSFSVGAVIGIVVSCSVLFIGLVILGVYAVGQKKKAQKADQIANPFASWAPGSADVGGAPQLKTTRPFCFEDIKKITNNFSGDNQIGVGGYGKVYKATLSDGQVVAIKRAQKGSMQGALEFKTEIELLSRIHHKNLVGLVGFCHDKGEQMLIYEHITNGTLRENLTGKTGNRLDWSRRLKIALGSAGGLAYLHDHADPPIIHRDIKSVNILLDDNLTAKVADFGLSKQVSDAGKGQVSTQIKGTLGYLDPEYYTTQLLTAKSDVYSFGVVMLELITSTAPITQGKYLVKEIRAALKWEDQLHCGLRDLIDPFLVSKTQLVGFSKFLDLALRCVQESSPQRPTMNEVVKEIEALLDEASDGSSISLSATDFGKSDAAPHQLYDSMLPSGSIDSSSFRNSMSYNFQSHISPK